MKRKIALAGMALALLFSFFGILTMCGVFCDGLGSPSSSPYDSGFAVFGGDYNTYSVNNAAEAASGARVAAYNLCDIAHLLEATIGLSMLFGGLLVFCAFFIVYSGCEKESSSVCAYTCTHEISEPVVMEEEIVANEEVFEEPVEEIPEDSIENN